MLLLDILMRNPPAWFGTAIAQATATATRGPWTTEDGAEVIPVAIPNGVWLEAQTSLGTFGFGAENGAPALRAPSALAWMVRRQLPVLGTRPEGNQTVLVLDLPTGVVLWLPLPGLEVGLRLVPDVEIAAA